MIICAEIIMNLTIKGLIDTFEVIKTGKRELWKRY